MIRVRTRSHGTYYAERCLFYSRDEKSQLSSRVNNFYHYGDKNFKTFGAYIASKLSSGVAGQNICKVLITKFNAIGNVLTINMKYLYWALEKVSPHQSYDDVQMIMDRVFHGNDTMCIGCSNPLLYNGCKPICKGIYVLPQKQYGNTPLLCEVPERYDDACYCIYMLGEKFHGAGFQWMYIQLDMAGKVDKNNWYLCHADNNEHAHLRAYPKDKRICVNSKALTLIYGNKPTMPMETEMNHVQADFYKRFVTLIFRCHRGREKGVIMYKALPDLQEPYSKYYDIIMDGELSEWMDLLLRAYLVTIIRGGIPDSVWVKIDEIDRDAMSSHDKFWSSHLAIAIAIYNGSPGTHDMVQVSIDSKLSLGFINASWKNDQTNWTAINEGMAYTHPKTKYKIPFKTSETMENVVTYDDVFPKLEKTLTQRAREVDWIGDDDEIDNDIIADIKTLPDVVKESNPEDTTMPVMEVLSNDTDVQNHDDNNVTMRDIIHTLEILVQQLKTLEEQKQL
jgi:hypothetical protein